MERLLQLLEENARLPVEDLAAMLAATPEEVYEAVQENAAHGGCELPACVLAAPVAARCGRTKK